MTTMSDYKGIDEAISKLRAQVIQDAYANGGYAGSVNTQALAVEQIEERRDAALAVLDDKYKSIVQALFNGVIADVKDAGMQVRERYL